MPFNGELQHDQLCTQFQLECEPIERALKSVAKFADVQFLDVDPTEGNANIHVRLDLAFAADLGAVDYRLDLLLCECMNALAEKHTTRRAIEHLRVQAEQLLRTIDDLRKERAA